MVAAGVRLRPVRGDGVAQSATAAGIDWWLVILTLLTAGSAAALCPTPETRPLSSADLLEAATGTRLAWRRAPQGTLASYQCDPGYLAAGSTIRTCRSDGSWTGTAPRCYLNVASQTSLVRRPALVDGNKSTSVELTQLDGTDVEFYSVPSPEGEQPYRLPNVYEIRLITSGEQDLQGWTISVSTPSPGGRCVQQTDHPAILEIEQSESRIYPDGREDHAPGQQPWIHTFRTKSCFKKISIRESDRTRKKDSSVLPALVYEIQMVTKSLGASDHRCRLPDSGGAEPLASWAAGGLCCHLFSTKLAHPAADRRCRQLGRTGQLLRLHGAGLRNFTGQLLRQQSEANRWSEQLVWTAAAARRNGNQTHSTLDLKNPTEWEATSHAENRTCPGLEQVKQWRPARASCEDKWMFICQTVPSQCGSPALEAGQRYEPAPRPNLTAADVTCAGDSVPSGTVTCRHRRWTRPHFCDTGAVLGLVMGSVAGFLLLVGCVLLIMASYMRHKRDNAEGWETYTYIRRLSRLSRYGGRQRGLIVTRAAENTCSEPVNRAGPRPSVAWQRPPSSSWSRGAPPAGRRADPELPPLPSLPTPSAGLENPHFGAPPLPPPPAAVAVEYCVPMVQGQRQSPRLRLAGRSTDGSAIEDAEYAVPYDARRQGGPGPCVGTTDVVTSGAGM